MCSQKIELHDTSIAVEQLIPVSFFPKETTSFYLYTEKRSFFRDALFSSLRLIIRQTEVKLLESIWELESCVGVISSKGVIRS